MIRIENLRKSYGEKQVLKDISLTLKPGMINAIAGPNACGKTTLIKCILGLAVPDAGSIFVRDRSGSGEHRVDGGWAYRSIIGYMPQNPEFPGNLTCREILGMLEDVRSQKAPRKQELLDRFKLKEVLSQPFGDLSGGTKQKIAAVAAFMFDAPILILDEPTVGLDPVASVQLKDLIRKSSDDGKTILLVSHIMSEVEQLVQQMVFLLDGNVVFSGATEELKKGTGEDRIENAIVRMMERRQP